MSGNVLRGREALAAFLRAHGALHDAGIAAVEEKGGDVLLCLRELWGDDLDRPSLLDAELAFIGARSEWDGREDVAGHCVHEASLTAEGLVLVTDAGRLRVAFRDVEVRTPAPGGALRPPLVLHASVVRWKDRGLLIRGASGSGKSALALDLMAWGCALVADDRVELRREGGALLARCPEPIRGLIEARGVGLLRAPAVEAEVVLVADLDRVEAERLPPLREEAILGVTLPVLHKPATGGFAPALLQYLRGGRADPEDPVPRPGQRPP